MMALVVGAGCGVEPAPEQLSQEAGDPVRHQVQEAVGLEATAGMPYYAECTLNQQRHNQWCNLMAHRLCTSRGYASGWFRGDMAQYPDGLRLGVDCVTTPVVGVDAVPGDPSYSECLNSGLGSAIHCSLMAHYTCKNRGYSSGWFRGDMAQYPSGLHLGLMCATNSVGFTDAVPSTPFYNECYGSVAQNTQYCNLMANRACTQAGYQTGFYRGDQAQYPDGLHFGATCLELKTNLPPNQPPGQCGPQQGSGSNAAFSRDYNLFKNAGTFLFRRNANDIKDRFVVTYQGALLYDSGCISGNSAVNLSYSGASSYVNVTVYPNCDGTSSTQWDFTVDCP